MSFPDYIDNTTREALTICMMKAKRSHIDEIAPEARSVHLVAGGAFAKGIEVTRRAYWEQGKPAAECITLGKAALIAEYGDFTPPPNSYKTPDNMARALDYYFRTWPLGGDGLEPIILPSSKRAIEMRFKIEIPDVIHPDHGGPIYYVGRPDMVARMGDIQVIEDDKTASSLGDSWVNGWDLDSQSTGYVWAMKKAYDISANTVLIRGISILKPKVTQSYLTVDQAMEALMAGEQVYDKTDARGKTRYYRVTDDIDGSFGRNQALVERPQWMVDRWEKQLIRDVQKLVHAYLNDDWEYALHKGACNAYGGCPYKLLCESAEPSKWIPVHYVHRVWNPLDET